MIDFRKTFRNVLGRNPYGRRTSLFRMIRKLVYFGYASFELSIVLMLPTSLLRLLISEKYTVDVFVIGVQKSGTTWLHREISKVTGVHTPVQKECHHFDLGRLLSLYHYFKRIKTQEKNQLIVEIEPDYGTLNTWRIQVIKKLFPKAKIIVFLRDPIMRSWSAAKMEVAFVNDRAVTDVKYEYLSEYLRSRRCKKHSNYNEILNKWISVYGRSSVHIYSNTTLLSQPDYCIPNILSTAGYDVEQRLGETKFDKQAQFQGDPLKIKDDDLLYLEQNFKGYGSLLLKLYGDRVDSRSVVDIRNWHFG